MEQKANSPKAENEIEESTDRQETPVSKNDSGQDTSRETETQDKDQEKPSVANQEFQTFEIDEKSQLARKLKKLVEDGIYNVKSSEGNFNLSKLEHYILEAVGVSKYVFKDPQTGEAIAILSTARKEDPFAAPVVEEAQTETIGNDVFEVTYDPVTNQETSRILISSDKLPEVVSEQEPLPIHAPEGSKTELLYALEKELGDNAKYVKVTEKDGEVDASLNFAFLLGDLVAGKITPQDAQEILEQNNEHFSGETLATEKDDLDRKRDAFDKALEDAALITQAHLQREQDIIDRTTTHDKQEVTQHTFAEAINSGHLGRYQVMDHAVDKNGYYNLVLMDPDKPLEKFQISADPNESKMQNVMGPPAPIILPDEEERIRERIRIEDSERQALNRINQIQERERLAAEADSVSNEELTALAFRHAQERQIVSSIQRITGWLDEDIARELPTRIRDLKAAHPTWAVEQVIAEAQRGLDSRKFTRVREEAEEVIRIAERNPEAEFSSGLLNELYGALSILVDRGYRELHAEIENKIKSRAMYRAAFMKMKYGKGNEMGASLKAMLPEQAHEAFFTPGVPAAVEILERQQGEYYRKSSIDLADLKVELLQMAPVYAEEDKDFQIQLRNPDGTFVLNPDGTIATNKDFMRNDGGYGVRIKSLSDMTLGPDGTPVAGETAFSKEAFVYAFKTIRESIEDGAKRGVDYYKTPRQIAEALVKGETVEEQVLHIEGQRLRIRADQVEYFIKCLNFADRAFDIADEAMIIFGAAADAAGPVQTNNREQEERKERRLAKPDVILSVGNNLEDGFFNKLEEFLQKEEDFNDIRQKRLVSFGFDEDSTDDSINGAAGISAAQKEELKAIRNRIRDYFSFRGPLIGGLGFDIRTANHLLSDAQKNHKDTLINAAKRTLARRLAGRKVNINNVAGLSTEDYLIVDKIRDGSSLDFSKEWTQEWMKYFRGSWNDINFDNSLGSRGPRELMRLLYLPVYLNKSSTRVKGSAEELRRETFLGAHSAMHTISARNVREVVTRWGDWYRPIAYVSDDRLGGAESIKKLFYEGKERLLSNWNMIQKPDEFIGTFSTQMVEYMKPEERGFVINSWVEALMHFDLHNLRKYGFENFNQVEAQTIIDKMYNDTFINDQQRGDLERREFGNWFWRWTKFHAKKGKWISALFEFIGGLFKQGAQTITGGK